MPDDKEYPRTDLGNAQRKNRQLNRDMSDESINGVNTSSSSSSSAGPATNTKIRRVIDQKK